MALASYYAGVFFNAEMCRNQLDSMMSISSSREQDKESCILRKAMGKGKLIR